MSFALDRDRFGRKTVIDQASCNVDASCLKGDCPAFITVKPGKAKRKRATSTFDDLPAPTLAVAGRRGHPACQGSAAPGREGQPGAGSRGADRRRRRHDRRPDRALARRRDLSCGRDAGRSGPRRSRVLLAFDASAAAANLAGLNTSTSVAVVSTSVTPDRRDDRQDRLARARPHAIRKELGKRTDATRNLYVDSSQIVTALLGNAVTERLQWSGLPTRRLHPAAWRGHREGDRARDGTAVEARPIWLRSVGAAGGAVDSDAVATAAGAGIAYDITPYPIEGIDRDAVLPSWSERHAGDIVLLGTGCSDATSKSWSTRTASRWREVARHGTFTSTVARHLHHVMAYKDEYEVARLLLAGRAG